MKRSAIWLAATGIVCFGLGLTFALLIQRDGGSISSVSATRPAELTETRAAQGQTDNKSSTAIAARDENAKSRAVETPTLPSSSTSSTSPSVRSPADDHVEPSGRNPDQNQTVTSIATSAELLQALLDDPPEVPGKLPSMARLLHGEMKDEPGDAQWAAAAKAQLLQYISAASPELLQRVEFPPVECRTTLCEVLAVTRYGLSDSEADYVVRNWQQLMDDAVKQPWWFQLGFVDFQTTMQMSPDRRSMFVTHLSRSPPQ